MLAVMKAFSFIVVLLKLSGLGLLLGGVRVTQSERGYV